MTEHSTKIYLWPSSVLNTFVKRTPGVRTQTAVLLGYRALKIYEVYHWNETTKYDSSTGEGGLFAQYINTFLKFKQKASGPPDWKKNIEDAEKYIQENLRKRALY